QYDTVASYPNITLIPYTTLFRSPTEQQLVAGPVAPQQDRLAKLREDVIGDRHARHRGDHPTSSLSVFRTITSRRAAAPAAGAGRDRKSTRLNSSHVKISYDVFCL